MSLLYSTVKIGPAKTSLAAPAFHPLPSPRTSREELERRMALLQGNFSKRGCDLEQVVLNLTGGNQREEILELTLKTRIINLACMDVPEDIKSWPLGALPFVGLMRNAEDETIANNVSRASAEGGEHRLLLIAAIYEFASLGK